MHAALQDYRLSLPHERRILFDRYRLEDFAVKAVGIGSVGTYCFVGLFFSAENHPCFCNSRKRVLPCWRLTREKASTRTRGNALSQGSG
ncbi:DUF2252 domain-containing protein [Pseudomonas putida]|uniref:DUF2252 domain-containing protein n=1 Tax=Pseudomonas putida TaxID=303 RepID=UPI0021AB6ADD|nr:DUF2252 domain-containing protein [Pseudomonas putida]